MRAIMHLSKYYQVSGADWVQTGCRFGPWLQGRTRLRDPYFETAWSVMAGDASAEPLKFGDTVVTRILGSNSSLRGGTPRDRIFTGELWRALRDSNSRPTDS